MTNVMWNSENNLLDNHTYIKKFVNNNNLNVYGNLQELWEKARKFFLQQNDSIAKTLLSDPQLCNDYLLGETILAIVKNKPAV